MEDNTSSAATFGKPIIKILNVHLSRGAACSKALPGFFKEKILQTLVEASKCCSKFPKEPFLKSSRNFWISPDRRSFEEASVSLVSPGSSLRWSPPWCYWVFFTFVDFFVSTEGIHDFIFRWQSTVMWGLRATCSEKKLFFKKKYLKQIPWAICSPSEQFARQVSNLLASEQFARQVSNLLTSEQFAREQIAQAEQIFSATKKLAIIQ